MVLGTLAHALQRFQPWPEDALHNVAQKLGAPFFANRLGEILGFSPTVDFLKIWRQLGKYPLVIVYITMENHHLE